MESDEIRKMLQPLIDDGDKYMTMGSIMRVECTCPQGRKLFDVAVTTWGPSPDDLKLRIIPRPGVREIRLYRTPELGKSPPPVDESEQMKLGSSNRALWATLSASQPYDEQTPTVSVRCKCGQQHDRRYDRVFIAWNKWVRSSDQRVVRVSIRDLL